MAPVATRGGGLFFIPLKARPDSLALKKKSPKASKNGSRGYRQTTLPMKTLRALFSKGKGNWERVSYGEKGDFYLIFTVSSRTEQGYKVALSAYKQFVNGYKEKQ